MKNKPLLRKAIIADANAIAQVYLRSRKDLVPFAPLVHTDESIYQWISKELLTKEQVLVAEEKGVIIGMMSLKHDKGYGWIRQLYIHPDAVGQGVGTLFIKKAKTILGSPIRLYTFQENTRAKRFYEFHGFQAIHFDDGSDNEEHCPAVLYEWRGVK
jgi:GNAT superfamily N-acetyltransferase